jgi:hypothetical protein
MIKMVWKDRSCVCFVWDEEMLMLDTLQVRTRYVFVHMYVCLSLSLSLWDDVALDMTKVVHKDKRYVCVYVFV